MLSTVFRSTKEAAKFVTVVYTGIVSAKGLRDLGRDWHDEYKIKRSNKTK